MKKVALVFAGGATTSAWVNMLSEFGSAEEAMKYVPCAVETPGTLEATTLSLQMTWDTDSGSPTAKAYQRDDGAGALETVTVPLAANKVVQLPISDFPVIAPKMCGVINTGGAGSSDRTLWLVFRKVG